MQEDAGVVTTEQRRTGLWVMLATAAVCLLVYTLGNVHPKPPAPSGPPPLETVPSGMSLELRPYEAAKNWGGLLRTVERMSPGDDMLPIEQHDYFRLAPLTYEHFGMHAKAASGYRKYLEWSASIHNPECRRCHTPPNGNFPGTIAEMTQSEGGERYVLQLRAEHRAAAETKQVKALVEKASNDPAPRLVLYHLLRWGGDSAGAAQQAAWLRHCDELLTAPPTATPR